MALLDDYYKKLIDHKNDPLFKNSYYLIGNTFVTAAIGFIFWIIAARLYTTEQIGISSAIISAMSLITIFSLLGLDISIIRYLPDKDKKGLINTSFTITSIVTLLLSTIFISGLNFWAPNLIILKEDFWFGVAFIIFTVFYSIFTLQLSVFIGFKAVKYSFLQSFINMVKIVLLPLLIILGAFGIFVSFGFFYVVAFFVGNIFISRFFHAYKYIPSIKPHLLKDMIRYSFDNYISNIFYSIPNFLLPLIVLNVLGAVTNAYFYIAWTFSTIMLTIPFAVSRSLLAEGSSSPVEVKTNIYRTFKFTFTILGLANILIIIFGKFILNLFGAEYAVNGYYILIILSLTSFPFAFVQLFTSLKRIEKDMKPVIVVNIGVAVITIILGYLLMEYLGLIGIGYSWLTANILIAIYVLFRYKKEIF